MSTRKKRDEHNEEKRKIQKKRRSKKTLIVSILFIMMVFIIGFTAYVFSKIDDTLNKVTIDKPIDLDTIDEDDKQTSPSLPTVSTEEKNTRYNILILGIDYRPKLGGRNSDVIMVVSLDEKTKTGALFSIPRDTKVRLFSTKETVKANAVFYFGETMAKSKLKEEKVLYGLSEAKKTFSEYLDIPIDNAVIVDFKAFVDVIDALGGIKIDVERSLEYDDPTDGTHINLKKGEQKLTGDQALGYVRHRMDNRGERYYSSDFDRNARQQKVVRAVVDKASSFDGVKNFTELLDAAGNHIQTDFTKDSLLDMIWNFKGLKPDQLITIENKAFWDGKSASSKIPREVLEQVKEIYDHP